MGFELEHSEPALQLELFFITSPPRNGQNAGSCDGDFENRFGSRLIDAGKDLKKPSVNLRFGNEKTHHEKNVVRGGFFCKSNILDLVGKCFKKKKVFLCKKCR